MTNPLTVSLLVGLGGCAGSLARYGLSLTAQRFTVAWPLGTMTANVLACLLIGLVTGLSARGEAISPEVRLARHRGVWPYQ